jgi:HEAT repeat protein
MSNSYQDFLEKFLQTNMRERGGGTPLDLLDKLNDEEKLKAEEELLKKLDGSDKWIIEGLAHLKSGKALPKLYELLNKESESLREKKFDKSRKAFVALAIWKICEDEKMLDVVLRQTEYSTDEARSPYIEYIIVDVVHCLAQFPQPEALEKLKSLTKDKHDLISYNANYAIDLRRNLYKIQT